MANKGEKGYSKGYSKIYYALAQSLTTTVFTIYKGISVLSYKIIATYKNVFLRG